ncbi:MAG: hypothetical protein IPM83_02310 [Ignavibacteria bacterium]|nr:hypothetical protein [Ignavibacteria bacterium]MBK9181956.1 hypothetical protein [Ignavibacteria bacterium]
MMCLKACVSPMNIGLTLAVLACLSIGNTAVVSQIDFQVHYQQRMIVGTGTAVELMPSQFDDNIPLIVQRLAPMRLDATHLRLSMVNGIVNDPAFEKNKPSDCQDGSVVVVQEGFDARRYVIIPRTGAGTVHTQIRNTPYVITEVVLHGAGLMYAYGRHKEAPDTTMPISFISTDCGDNWIEMNGYGDRNRSLRSAILLSNQALRDFLIVRNGQVYNAPYLDAGSGSVHSIALLGMESILVMKNGKGQEPDTLCFGSLAEGSVSCKTSVAIDGVQHEFNRSRMRIISSGNGIVFMRNSTTSPASFHRWIAGGEFGPSMTPMEYGSAPDITYTPSDVAESQVLKPSSNSRWGNSIVEIDPASSPMIRIADSSQLMYPHVTDVRRLAPQNILLIMSRCLVLANPFGYVSVASLLNDVDVLGPEQILNSVVTEDGVVHCKLVTDCLLRSVNGVGLLEDRSVSGFVRDKTTNGPYDYTALGFRQMVAFGSKILTPGTKLRMIEPMELQYDTLFQDTTSSVVVSDDGSIVFGVKGGISRIEGRTLTSSFSLGDLLPINERAESRYVSSLINAGNGRLVAFVSGLNVRDAETLEAKIVLSGYVLASSDNGSTWRLRKEVRDLSYFVTSVALPNGKIATLSSRVIRDTSFIPTPLDPESVNHTIDDAAVTVFDIDGNDWNETHRQSLSRGLTFTGGDGVVLSDSTVLLAMPTGIIASDDLGSTWRDFQPTSAQPLGEVISMTYNGSNDILYLNTTTGCFRSSNSTSVNESSELLNKVVLRCIPWNQALSMWHQNVIAMYDVLGRSVVSPESSMQGIYLLTNSRTGETFISVHGAE